MPIQRASRSRVLKENTGKAGLTYEEFRSAAFAIHAAARCRKVGFVFLIRSSFLKNNNGSVRKVRRRGRFEVLINLSLGLGNVGSH